MTLDSISVVGVMVEKTVALLVEEMVVDLENGKVA